MLEITTSADEIALGVDFTSVYKNSELYRRNKALIKQLSKPGPGSKDLYFPSQYSQSFFTQCMACLWRDGAFAFADGWSFCFCRWSSTASPIDNLRKTSTTYACTTEYACLVLVLIVFPFF